MVFSSHIFLFVFLPAVIFGYFAFGRYFKNTFLFLASLFFYAWGEPLFVILMLFSVAVNFLLGICTERLNRRLCLVVACVFDLGMLFVFKYLPFCMETLNGVFSLSVHVPKITMPIGISFYTFQMLSYVIDVYRGNVKPQRSFIKLGLYISFFPQLIAGPIVRYTDIEKQLENRTCSIEAFCEGVRFFIIGFSKKILIADTVSHIADSAFSASGGYAWLYWLGITAYTIQIYFDFSGYSDMAIGLGKMFGFDLCRNFDYPYASKSIREFWRRWHISLGAWFRDYVYIPLGGSKKGLARTCVNTMVVFLLTGIWHGAGGNFIVWGIYYGAILVLERLFLGKILDKSKIVSRIYTILAVVFGWVLFRADTFGGAVLYFKGMFGLLPENAAFVSIRPDYIFFLIVGIILSFPIFNKIKRGIFFDLLLCVLFFAAVLYMTGSGFSPFLYFRF